MTTADRTRAADMARTVRAGLVSFDAFAREFGDSEDALIATLFELIEHEPQRAGLLGVSEQEHAAYADEIERCIRDLEKRP